MCDRMKKPTGSSGIDDFTAKCQTLNCALFSIKQANTFDDSDDEDEFSRQGGDMSDDDSSEAAALEVTESTQTSLNTPTAAAELSHSIHHQIMTGSSKSVSRTDTKSKTQLNLGKHHNIN